MCFQITILNILLLVMIHPVDGNLYFFYFIIGILVQEMEAMIKEKMELKL